MKEYVKPEVEIFEFSSEVIAGPTGVVSGDGDEVWG
jgi:hypothetical protein